MGSNNVAVSSNATYNASYAAWYAFDNDGKMVVKGNGEGWAGARDNNHLIFYCPVKIKIENCNILNTTNHCTSSYSVYKSNDNVSYIQLKDNISVTTGSNTIWLLEVDNTEFNYYYKFTFIADNYVDIQEMNINAACNI